MRKILGAMVVTGIVCLQEAPAQKGLRPNRFVGYRDDVSGVFRDCVPVTEWNEWELTLEKVKVGPRTVEKVVVGEEKRINIVWKTPLAQWSNGGMLVVDGKLFLECDRGGTGFADRVVPDFLGNLLVCMDPATGKILWKRDSHHLDKLPESKRAKVEADLTNVNTFYVESYIAFLKYRDVAGPLVGGGHGQHDYSKEMPDGYGNKYVEAAKAFKPFWTDVPLTVDQFRVKEGGRNRRIWTSNRLRTAFGKFVERVHPKKEKKRDGLGEYGYAWCAWFGDITFIGAATQTPVSDREHIFVHTGYNDVFCYDLDGNRVWCTWFGPMGEHHAKCLGSPVLAGDKLIVNGGADLSLKARSGGKSKGNYVRALDKKTGRVVWLADEFDPGKSYTRITPVPLSLAVAGGDEVLDVVWTGPGNVFRVSDGKLVGEKLGCHGNGRGVAVTGDVIILVNGSSEAGPGSPSPGFGTGTVAIRLKAENTDEVVGEELWSMRRGPGRLVALDNRVYGFGGSKGCELQALDLLTGKVISGMETEPSLNAHHLTSLAGDYLFGMDHDGRCVVVSTEGDQLKQIAMNRLGKGQKQWCGGAQPFFSGNRIFIRSYTAVYCIGNPDEPMRLSKQHM